MKTHFENLKEHIPDLESLRVLDLGSGRGSFLVELAVRGVKSSGIELSLDYINQTLNKAKQAKVVVDVRQGVGESLPFPDKSFGFVNLSEVIEHVNNPDEVMREVFRTLIFGGKVYVSVPSRFSFKDPHFHLYFVNWLPRSLSDIFISLFGKHKKYQGDIGKQRLKELHYYTDAGARHLFRQVGFEVEDIRKIKIRKRFKNSSCRVVILMCYALISPILFSTYHYMLTKKSLSDLNC